jgi:phage terminase large subunit-like protein
VASEPHADLSGSLPKTVSDWKALVDELSKLDAETARPLFRMLCRTSVYFLLRFACGRKDIEKPWLLDRCNEVQDEPDGYLDLWSREHYKSTIITFGKSLQDILSSHGEDPLPKWGGNEVTIGIFSHTRPISRQFLRQIKQELERNELLLEWFPDVIWKNPQRDAPKWSEDDGLTVRRRTNPKESTVEAWGLVDGQPTSKHFLVMVYDDVVTISSVTTPDMIAKTTAALELSYNLGAIGGVRRFIGTRYHYNDTYRTILSRGTATPRVYPATEDGSVEGNPVLFPKDVLDQKRRDMGAFTFACQMLQDPRADESDGFREEWLRFYHGANTGKHMNKYVVVDPANEKKRRSDYTAVWVIGLGQDGNYYALDFYRDRLNLSQRADLLFKLHRKWKPRSVGYEKYGMQADIQHVQDRMSRDNYRFELTPLSGAMKKTDRIKRLLPVFSAGRFYLPDVLFRTNYEGLTQDLVEVFINEEFKPFPVSVHDDMLDALSRIVDPEFNTLWPKAAEELGDRYERASIRGKKKSRTWMAA